MNVNYMRRVFVMIASAFLLACGSHPEGVKQTVDSMPPIFPDYVGVTVPVNIAPLNFMIEGVEHLEAVFMRDGKELLSVNSRKGVVDIPMAKWHDMLEANVGAALSVKVRAWGGDNPEGVEYAPFEIFVSPDKIDEWVCIVLSSLVMRVGCRWVSISASCPRSTRRCW